VGWDAWRGGVADVFMRCRAVHISLPRQTDMWALSGTSESDQLIRLRRSTPRELRALVRFYFSLPSYVFVTINFLVSE
jgi:hypothetical protein